MKKVYLIIVLGSSEIIYCFYPFFIEKNPILWLNIYNKCLEG